eukprot:3529173-Rhodomonas_salina.3
MPYALGKEKLAIRCERFNQEHEHREGNCVRAGAEKTDLLDTVRVSLPCVVLERYASNSAGRCAVGASTMTSMAAEYHDCSEPNAVKHCTPTAEVFKE